MYALRGLNGGFRRSRHVKNLVSYLNFRARQLLGYVAPAAHTSKTSTVKH